MQHVDFTPLYRSTVGFDRLFKLLDTVGGLEREQTTYPPYNIEQVGENAYRISMAVAGFSRDEIAVEVKEAALTVKGEHADNGDQDRQFLHRGIAARSFERRFQLADHMEVKGADLKDGLLHIDLERNVPERLKARTIEIGGEGVKQIDAS
ncbi:MAG: Hsp20 family protein [Pseudomonadota bacterium]